MLTTTKRKENFEENNNNNKGKVGLSFMYICISIYYLIL